MVVMELKAGTTLILEQKEKGETTNRYRCKVAEMQEKAILTDYPVDDRTGKSSLLMKGSRFIASYTMNQKGYLLPVLFVRRVTGRIPMLMFAFEGEESIKEIQRRNFVRVDANLDVAVHSDDGSFPPFVTLTNDIGGGGTLIKLPEGIDLQEDDQVHVWLCLPRSSGDISYVKFNGRIARVFIDKHTNGRRASIEFRPGHEKERQPVIRFCFERQLAERKKRLDWLTNHPPD